MEKLLNLKEAKTLLGVCTKTIQRWDREGKIRCVRTPGGRRRVPESEILRIRGLTELSPTPEEPKIEQIAKPEAPVEKVTEPKAAPPAELPRHAILDELAPTGLTQRTIFGDLLSAAIVLGAFTLKEIADRARCPETVAKIFCEKMVDRDFLVDKNGGFELRVRLAR